MHLVAPSTFDNRTLKGASTAHSCEMGVLANVPAGVADLRIEQNRACVQPPFSQHCAGYSRSPKIPALQLLQNSSNSRLVRAIPWPSGRWRARRRIDTGNAGRLHSRERARGHVQPRCRGGGRVGRGKGCRRRPAGMAQHPRAGPLLRSVAHMRTADGAVDTAHGRAGGTDRRATGCL